MFSAIGFAQEGSFKAQMAAAETSSPRALASSPTTSPDTNGPDVFEVNFFRNANTAGFASSVVDIVNPGTNENGGGNVCAKIYVITPDEELAECCGCMLTPDQVIELSVNANLTANAATGTAVHNGAIKILSSFPVLPCDAGSYFVGGVPTLRAWITSDTSLTGTHQTVETEFARPDLSGPEYASLVETCASFEAHLSGHGICTCPATLPN